MQNIFLRIEETPFLSVASKQVVYIYGDKKVRRKLDIRYPLYS